MNENNPVKKDATAGKGGNFKGYTLDELRYQRALTALRREFCKSRVMSKVYNVRKRNPLSADNSGSTSGIAGKISYFLPKVINGMSYLDYAMMGFSAFASIRKIFSFFHRKKKKI